MSLEQIARETKINSHLLDAIEKNQFDLLPRGVFAKSFVRQYARSLGLDEEELAAEVQKAMHYGAELPSFAVVPAEPAFKVPKLAAMGWSGRPPDFGSAVSGNAGGGDAGLLGASTHGGSGAGIQRRPQRLIRR